ncbi:MFS transporter [Rhizobium sp. KVB221]|uniref:MFS transporter n=1 Tax=Rhizobium setariae TaxID=2801340 RepID=A0A936YR38_9HYPH|nr:RsmB/NOP family class I SAM-dependent RNA methyltransferase [Rhizobium setariae]MBL0374133.1 MFS transporter [Rhizobium setariae]
MTSDYGRRSQHPAAKHGKGRTPRTAEPDKPGFQARAAAVKIMSAVIGQKTPLDGMLDDHHGNPAFSVLSLQDRALVRAILNSGLRHLTWIDAIFNSYLDKPLPEGASHLRHILSVAATQILFLDVPDHSAVDIAVEQARRDPRSSRFANLVNALLRRLGREKHDVLEGVSKAVSPLPAWYEKRLVATYGKETTAAIAEAYLKLAPIDLTVKSDPQHWADTLGGTVLPTGTVRLDKFDGAVTELTGFADGVWWVQDAAAAIPARLLGDIKGKRVADLCAAPGGKTAQLIVQGANVTAVEQSASRIKRMKSNFDRLGLTAEIVNARLEEYEPAEPFDAVLLDAPCSSTGTIRRHPDVLWTKGVDDIETLARVQYNLLVSAFALVRPGGTIVFSNCSLDRLEGEEVVEKFLRANPNAERAPIAKQDWPGLEEAITELGEIRTTPATLGGMDGFFAAVIRRKQ